MIYYISGGERSGKSAYGEQLALSLSSSPVYLATSRVWDADFQARIDKHKNTRDDSWINREQEKDITTVIYDKEVILVDCVTLWITNYFTDLDADIEACLNLIKPQIDKIATQDVTVIFISNEIGMGGHATNRLARKFTELQGYVNQYIAQKSTKATVMISGLPLSLKA